jgi:hypothetical protein
MLACALTGAMGIAVLDAAAGTRTGPDQIARAAQTAAPLSNEALYQLYNSRSWHWKDGAGHFSVKQRRFTAWSGSGKSASFGVGTWFLTEPGKLCFKADWVAKDGKAGEITCFSHRQKAGVVFQKREPDGEWYVFKHARARRGDEITKLRSGDIVSPRLGKIQQQVLRGR